MSEALNTRLKELIKERGISQRSLAERAEVTESSVCHYLKGDRVPSSGTLTKLATALGTTPDYLLVGEPFDENGLLIESVERVKRNASYLSRAQKLELIESLIDQND